MTEKSIVSFLERIAAGDVPPLGGRSLSQRIKRLCFEVLYFSNFDSLLSDKFSVVRNQVFFQVIKQILILIFSIFSTFLQLLSQL